MCTREMLFATIAHEHSRVVFFRYRNSCRGKHNRAVPSCRPPDITFLTAVLNNIEYMVLLILNLAQRLNLARGHKLGTLSCSEEKVKGKKDKKYKTHTNRGDTVQRGVSSVVAEKYKYRLGKRQKQNKQNRRTKTCHRSARSKKKRIKRKNIVQRAVSYMAYFTHRTTHEFTQL